MATTPVTLRSDVLARYCGNGGHQPCHHGRDVDDVLAAVPDGWAKVDGRWVQVNYRVGIAGVVIEEVLL